MANRRKPARTAEPQSVMPPPVPTSKVNDDALGEVVGQLATEAHVEDPTQQLFFNMAVKTLLNMENIDWKTVFQTAAKRLLVSFLTHQITHALIDTAHHVAYERLGL